MRSIKPNFSSLVSESNSTHSACNLIRSHHFLSPAILTSVNSAASVITLIPKQPVLDCCLYCPLQTWLL